MRLLLVMFGILLPSLCHAHVVISEVLWAGSPLSTADEWLELYNTSDETISLAGWVITKRSSDGGDTPMITFSDDDQISAGHYYLIANYDADRSVLAVAPDKVSTAVSLANTKLFLQLLDGDEDVIDSVDDGIGTPFAGGKNPYASMERIDLLASGTDPTNWKTAEDSTGFDEGVEVFGTPRKEAKEAEEDKEAKESSSLSEERNSSSISFSTSSEFSTFHFPFSTSNVRITEVLLDPADSEDYEWIELGNLGDTPVNISGWILSDGSRSHTIEPRSQSGYILEPLEHTVFFHYQTGIALSNQGELLTLFDDDTEIDRLDVSETGEEISFGRESDGSRGPFCIPTPREINSENPLNPQISVQSGRSTDYTKVTLNLKATVDEGSLKDAQCFWNFDDGTTSEKCNPPSHSWDNVDVYRIVLRVMTKCGNEIERGMDVVVLEKRKSKQSRKSKKSTITSSTAGENTRATTSYSSSSAAGRDARAPSAGEPPLLKLRRSGDTRSASSIEQKMYSSKSSSRSRHDPIETLQVRYKNIPQSSLSSYQIQHPPRINEQTNKRKNESSSQTSLPWTLLFSQSVLWIILAGKKMI